MLSRWRKTLVGLDIGSSAVKAVELRQRRGGCALAAFGVAPLPHGVVHDGAIADTDGVARAIRTLLEGAGFSTRAVALALPGNAVMVRRIELPAMSPKELDTSIYWEARQHVPFPAEDVALDYHVLSGAAARGAERPVEVLLVAARKERVASYTEAVERAGCLPLVVDVDALALLNAYELNYGIDPAGVVALLDVGGSTTSVSVVAAGGLAGSRELSCGARSYADAICGELDLEPAQAEEILRAAPGDGSVSGDARAVMRSVSDRIASETCDALEYLRGSLAIDDISELLVCGGAARVAGLADALAARHRAPVGVLDPFRRVTHADARDASPGALAAVATGLALRRVGER